MAATRVIARFRQEQPELYRQWLARVTDSPPVEANAVARRCWACGAPTFNQQAAHPCCVTHLNYLRVGRPCPGCDASRAAAKRKKIDVPWGGPPAPGYPKEPPR